MSRYVQALEDRVVWIDKQMPFAREPHRENRLSVLFRSLVESVFARNDTADWGKLVAFTSYSSREGVTHVVQSLGMQLANSRARPTLATTADLLIEHVLHAHKLSKSLFNESKIPNLWRLSRNSTWESSFLDGSTRCDDSAPDGAVQPLRMLRERFGQVLIDCRSLKSSADIANVAASCDGIVLVVEADRTRPREIELARNAIEAAHGDLLGCIINRRTYPIPNSLYRCL